MARCLAPNWEFDVILTIAGRVISRTAVQRITDLELGTSEVNEPRKKRIKALMHDDNHFVQREGERQLQDCDEYTDIQDEALDDEFNSAVSDDKI